MHRERDGRFPPRADRLRRVAEAGAWSWAAAGYFAPSFAFHSAALASYPRPGWAACRAE
jgi:hypothetical protein